MSTILVNEIQDTAGKKILQNTGSILQIVESGTIADHTNQNTNTFADTNMTVSITPTSSSNKILVSFSAVIRANFTGTLARGALRVKRTVGSTDTTLLMTDDFYEHFQVRNVSTEFSMVPNFEFLDSPSTTNQVTYTVQSYIRNDSGATSVIVRGSSRGTRMLAKEISA
tara:strand:+ start:213 stop:719 length:507 start_codon:yes stop_codon:yes gene_type:complete